MLLKIYLLGQFKLEVEERPIELPSRPAQSLLAYLALNAGATHRREKLAGLLWPEATESNARRYLRQALWRLRKALESASIACEAFLQISDISVTFDDRSNYWLDAEMLLEAAGPRPVDEIVASVRLYRGELLPGFYDEWIVLERDRLEAAYHQQMNLLLETLIENGQWEKTLKWSEQWIRLGHSPEPAYRALMRAYAGLGDQTMINATYQRCVESMERELGLEPSPVTRQLYEKICCGELEGPVETARHIAYPAEQRPSFLDKGIAPQIEEPVFVAREHELTRMDNHLNLALAGQGRAIFVTGETGSGKTALVQKFTRRAQDTHTDLIVASGNCNAHTGLGEPYLPFREILELLTGDVEARWAAGAITDSHARLLWNALPLTAQSLVDSGPELIDTFVPGPALLRRVLACRPDRASWLNHLEEIVQRKSTASGVVTPRQSELFEQYTRVLQSLARRFLLVLVVDDLQWADLGSISLLFHLGRQLAGCRILIIGAYRPEEVALGRDGERHPLEPVVNEFQRIFGDLVVNVDQSESRAFMEALLDNEPNRLGAPFRQKLYRQTRGHPLFTIELLRGMQERGDLVQDSAGCWNEGQALDWETLPARVEAVIAERIGRLAQPLQATLRVASVEGDVFTAEVVARVRGTEEREMLARLSGELDRKHRLVRAQSIQRMNGQLLSYYRFQHTLFQKYLYSTLDDVERVHLHELVGTTLEHLYGTEEETAASANVAPQLARHFQEARIVAKAIHYLHQAGDRAVRLSAYQEGITHLSRALDLLMTRPDTPERAEQELALQLSLGMAWMRDIPGPEWTNAYARARELSQQIGKTSQLWRILSEFAINHFVRAEHQIAKEFAQETLDLAQQAEDRLLIALGHWQLGFILFALGEYAKAHAHLQQIIGFYNTQEHHRLFVYLRGSDAGTSAMAYDACCLWCLGYPEQAAKMSQEVLDLARELNHPFSQADVICSAGCVLNSISRDAQALKDSSEELIRLANDNGMPTWFPPGVRYRGEALVMLGQLQEGIAQMQEGIAAAQFRNVRLNLPGTFSMLAQGQARAGRPDEGLSTLAQALALIEQTGERYCEPEHYRVRASLLLVQGDDAAAETDLNKAIEIARRQSAKSWELRAATDLARLWHQQGRGDEARELLAPIYGWFTEGFSMPDLREAKALLDDISS